MRERSQPYRVLFLCTGNSARSIFAECLMNRWGAGKFEAHSAGSQPRGEVHPLALRELQIQGYATDGLRSKSWEEFALAGAPALDFVFTVCDNAAGETCPLWPGQPMTAHWGIADPAAVEGEELTRMAAFATAFRELQSRISIFANLPISSLNTARLQRELDAIGGKGPAPQDSA